MWTRGNLLSLGAGLFIALAAANASANTYNIDWMSLAPTPFGSAPPFVSSYNLAGIGTVNMTYSANSDFVEARLQVPQLAAGSVSYAGDSYAWTNQETLARTNWGFSGIINSSWFVTYTFPGTVPASKLVLGVQGLGRRDPNPGETTADATTEAIVLQNGTHFGDFTGALNVGPTQYTPGAGMFSMINSLSGPGGADPWWNTGLAVVRIDDAVNALTVRIDQTSGDGIGVNIGVITPEPATAALLVTGSLVALRRRAQR
ncbi:MAG TPA: PEP-CTERM sorting domain-containing protein [Phycisphaerae bacterium]|nr:PEP-CTERM sorting domain-containing protein [Phycisphaerales bacterium]HRX83425.1 PEP-CTERM sorting domain-containing protein [Phycisphaerae bacterium]